MSGSGFAGRAAAWSRGGMETIIVDRRSTIDDRRSTMI
jgi:hypothetical protein